MSDTQRFVTVIGLDANMMKKCGRVQFARHLPHREAISIHSEFRRLCACGSIGTFAMNVGERLGHVLILS